MRSRFRGAPTWPLVALATVVVVISALGSGVSLIRTLGLGNSAVVFLLVIAGGELARFVMPSGRIVAPVATASALGLAFMNVVDAEQSVQLSAGAVVLLVSLASLVSVPFQKAIGAEPRWGLKAAGILAVAAVAALARWDPFGLLPHDPDIAQSTWWTAAAMVVLSAMGVLIQVVLAGPFRADDHSGAFGPAIVQQVREAPALSVGLATSGPLMALLAPVIGLAAIPAALFPLVLSYIAVRRYLATRRTYREAILTLSRLTELAGVTPDRHAVRVAELAVAMGRHLALPQRDVEELELAALLHDVGQVGLTRAIPGGATVLAAPDDQRHIALEGARIVRRTGVLDFVADYLEHQATPYRQVRERGEDVPVPSRIIKVANAYEDFSAGRTEHHDAALERIHLGLGYEYDPLVVGPLMQVVGGAHPPHHSR
jgi:hypothetical protein